MKGARVLQRRQPPMGERNLSPCLMFNLWQRRDMVGYAPVTPPSFLYKYLRCEPSSPNRSLGELHTSTGSNGDIAVLLAQMAVICMQMRNKLNLVSPLTSCPIKKGSQSSKRTAATLLICHHRLITMSTLITICFQYKGKYRVFQVCSVKRRCPALQKQGPTRARGFIS